MKQTALYKIDYSKEREIFLASVDSSISIGKSSNANICLNDWRTNGIHALIKKDATGTCKIIDLGSLFGTYVNKKKVNIHTLSEGDIINIGSQDIVLRNAELTSSNLNLVEDLNLVKPLDNAGSGYQLISDKNILEVLCFWGDKLLEHKTFKNNSTITIGDPKRSTFGMLLQQFKDEEEIYKLARYKNNTLNIKIPREAQGIIWSDKKPIALDTLRNYDPKHIGKDVLDVSLRVGDSAHLEFGEIALTFKFTNPSEKIPLNLNFTLDRNLQKILAGILMLYLLVFSVAHFWPVAQQEKSLKDIPKHLKKVVYDIGVKNALEKRRAAIGQIAQNLEGGRARAEEGRSKTEKAVTQSNPTKSVVKEVTPNVKQTEQINQNTNKITEVTATQFEKVDLDSAFAEPTNVKLINKAAMLSDANVTGNTVSAIAQGSFARGRTGFGAGGGGKSVGIGSLSGNLTGGGMGSGDYGLKPSKGRQIDIKDDEQIVIEGGLDPDLIAAIIKRYGPQIQHCYEQGLVKKPTIKGKVTTNFIIASGGGVIKPKIIESTLHDSFTEKCIMQKIVKWKFPKPKGGGTVGVTWPFILMSNMGN
ncbi:MAG: hypothetical protein A2202_00310 [Bdellovibrionales bacterium RIFOXYA1_FULL_36_14]|nr:MAG: hypothetical protein A2202_00310 [Bdellovibrionales bacterium RIFOXYA1_FULL_36_14]